MTVTVALIGGLIGAAAWLGFDRFWGLFMMVAMFALGFAYPMSMSLMRSALRGQRLEVDGTILLKRTPDGRVMAQVDLDGPYTAECLYVGCDAILLRPEAPTRLWAIYRVRQGHRTLRFTSEAEGSDRVVRDVLKMEWPPRARMPMWI
jgi:hypothetical protein